MNYNFSPEAVYNALFGNFWGFALLIIAIIIFVGVLIYQQIAHMK